MENKNALANLTPDYIGTAIQALVKGDKEMALENLENDIRENLSRENLAGWHIARDIAVIDGNNLITDKSVNVYIMEKFDIGKARASEIKTISLCFDKDGKPLPPFDRLPVDKLTYTKVKKIREVIEKGNGISLEKASEILSLSDSAVKAGKKATADKATTDKATADKATTDNATANKATADKATANGKPTEGRHNDVVRDTPKTNKQFYLENINSKLLTLSETYTEFRNAFGDIASFKDLEALENAYQSFLRVSQNLIVRVADTVKH